MMQNDLFLAKTTLKIYETVKNCILAIFHLENLLIGVFKLVVTKFYWRMVVMPGNSEYRIKVKTESDLL